MRVTDLMITQRFFGFRMQVEAPVDGRAEFEFVEELWAQRPTIEPVWVTVSIAHGSWLLSEGNLQR